MSNDPKITVLMPVYNGERHLSEAIDSILVQTYRDYEFLIIDDGSNDQTLEIIKKFNDSRIRLIQNRSNIGIIKTLNKGIGESRGKYIARMDADDISLPERFRLQIEFLETEPQVALVGGQFSYIDNDGKIFAHEKVPLNNDTLQKQLLKKCCFSHPTVMIKTSVLKEVGGYNIKAHYAEDYELWLRIAENYQVANLKESILLYRVHPNQISINKVKHQVDMARQCRRDAIERRFPGCNHHEDYPGHLSSLEQLRGLNGSYGEIYYHWSILYKKMGASKECIKLAHLAFINSPLSLRIIIRLFYIILYMGFSFKKNRLFKRHGK
jgi:glycosyltransferase involved in cell wall biosynthesis